MNHSAFQYPETLEIQPFPGSLSASVSVPGSKSITNRALVLAAIRSWWGDECVLTGALQSEDTEIMVLCLQQLGIDVQADWPTVKIARVDNERREFIVPADAADLFLGNSGTSLRFLTALCAISQGRYRLDGVPRMRERPIEDLLDALRQAGVKARSEFENGCPPVIVESSGWLKGDGVIIKGNLSSQFISALLMVAPFNDSGHFCIKLEGSLVSEPYLEMTEKMMRHWGATWGYNKEQRIRVFNDESKAHYFGHPAYSIEPDASAASYFFAVAAILHGQVTVLDLPYDGLQGDVHFVDILEQMGCRIEKCASGITVHGGNLRGIDVDMNAISDTVMTLGAVACFANGPTTIRNVGHIRHKETDRIAALAAELRKVGAEVEEFADGLKIMPGPLHGAEIDTYNDHRMAMSMALIGLRVPGIEIRNPGCVAKTYPGFWEDLEKLRSPVG